MASPYKECKKGRTSVLICYAKTIAPFNVLSGMVQLTKRIDYCIGFRVIAGFALPTAGTQANWGGSTILSSNKLSQLRNKNSYYVGTTIDATTQTVNPISTVIGSFVLNGLGPNSSQLDSFNANPVVYFDTPSPIESFDWTLGPVNGTWTFTAKYTVEFQIDFLTLCQCDGGFNISSSRPFLDFNGMDEENV